MSEILDAATIAADLRELATQHPGKYVDPQGRTAGLWYERDPENPDVWVEAPDREFEDESVEQSDCVYFAPDGAPSCIVGHVLARHGVTYESLADEALFYPTADATPEVRQRWYNQAMVRVLCTGKTPVLQVEKDALDMLVRAQMSQDAGETWADSVQYAMHKDEEEK